MEHERTMELKSMKRTTKVDMLRTDVGVSLYIFEINGL